MSELSVGLRKGGLGFLVDGFDALETKVTGIQVTPPPNNQVSATNPAAGTQPDGISTSQTSPGVAANPVEQAVETVASNAITDVGDTAKSVVENAINSKFPAGTQFTDEAVNTFGAFLEQAALHFLETAVEHVI